MPYSKDNPPEKIKDLPAHAQSIWIAAYNSANEQGNSEESCNKIAWNAVKQEYEQDADGKWHKKASQSRTTRGELIALAAGEPSGNTLTIQVLRAGEFTDMSGKDVTVDETDLDTYVANSNAALAQQQVPVEIGHPDESGAPAAAWYRKFFKKVVSGVTWVCAEIELTALGAKSLSEQLYKYFSANLYLDSKTIAGGGFVNRPAVTGQQPVGSLSAYLRPKPTPRTNPPSRLQSLFLQIKRTLGMVELEMSQEDLRMKINKALDAKYGDAMMGGYSNYYVIATFPDRVICAKEDKYFEISYTLENDEVSLGDPAEVEISWTPKPSSDASMGTRTKPNRGGESTMTEAEIQAKIEAARAEERTVALAAQRDVEAKLAKARQEERERVLAEQKRVNEIHALAAELTTGPKAFWHKPAELEELLAKLTDDDRALVAPLLRDIRKKGLVDLAEHGHQGQGAGGKELPKEIKPLLKSWLAAKDNTVAGFFAVNPELGQAEEYDLSAYTSTNGNGAGK